MTHDFKKLDEIHDEYHILLQGSADESKFGRVFNGSLRATHYLDFREEVVKDGEVRRKCVIVGMTPKGLKHIAQESDDFSELELAELRELIRRYAIELPKVEGRPDATQDKLAMVEALRAYEPPPPPKPADPRVPVVIIPPEIEALGIKDALTKAATLGVPTKMAGGKQADLPTIKQRIAKKLAERQVAA